MIVGVFPKSIFDILLWPILKIIWEPFTKKRSHFWHWVNFNANLIEKSIGAYGFPYAKERKNFWQRFWQTNFGWQSVVILEPEETDVPYHIGFISESEGKAQLCSIILKGKCACLVGPKETRFFALFHSTSYRDAREINLKISPGWTKKILSENINLI